jgi:hypothetical protein
MEHFDQMASYTSLQSDLAPQQETLRSPLAEITPVQAQENINVENDATEPESQQEVLSNKQIKQRGKSKPNKAAAAAIIGQKAIDDLKILKKKHELLEKENVTLLLNNERLKDKNADAETRVQLLRNEMKALQDEIKSWKLQKREWDDLQKSHEGKVRIAWQSRVAELEEEKEQWAEEKKDLLQEIGELQYDLDMKAPLIQNCVDIRARLYEQERVSPMHSTILKAEIDQDKIDAGHAAAHAGDFEVDRALFKLGLLDDSHVRAFQSLYCTGALKPQDFTWTWTPAFIEAMNAHFTINAGRATHEVMGTRRERTMAVIHHNKILELHEKLDPEKFEDNWEVHAEVTKLKILAKKMTDSFREHQGQVLRKHAVLQSSGAAPKK